MPCWIITPRLPREDTDPHYDTRGDALTAIREAWDENREHTRGLVAAALEKTWWRELRYRMSRLRPRAPEPRQAPGRCWVADCGTCGDVLANDDEGWFVHAPSLTDLHQSLDAYDWRLCPDEAYCPDDAPECSQLPPLSPAQLEAAGQLRLFQTQEEEP
jgi:hypothetical protein